MGAGGKITFSYCWEPVGRTLSHTVGSRWDFFSLPHTTNLLLTNHMLLLVCFSDCWEQVASHFSHIKEASYFLHLGNWWKVAFLILLGGRVEFLMGGKSVSHKTHRVSFDDVALLLLFGRGLLTRPFDRISMVGARDWHRMFLVLLGVGWKHTYLILLGIGAKSYFACWNWWAFVFFIL